MVLGVTLITGTLLGLMLAPVPVSAVAKEIIQLQQDVTRLLQAQRDLQRSVDEKHAVVKTLVEQQLDSVNRLSVTMGGLQKSVQDVQANSGARMDTLSTQTQSLADNLEEVKIRLGKLQQQMGDLQGVLQTLDAKLAGGAPMPAGTPPAGGTPPPSADVLYSNALRDYMGGKLDLARQQFTDYLKFFPENDLASNSQFYLGEILFSERQFQPAIGEYDKVLDNYPKSFKLADARYKKGLALLELQQRASALRELREVVRRHPGTDVERKARAKLRELGATAPGD
jgi:tol-pal system protein YbgF